VKQTETLDQTSIEPGQDNDGSTLAGYTVIRSDKSLKILIVEDDPVDLMAMRRMLGAGSEMSAELGKASSLAEALAALDQQCPDVVLLELDLPDSRGLDTVHKLMAHSTHPVCIIVTDCQSEQTASEAIALGVQEYLVKIDLNAKSLGRAIHHAVDRRRTEDRLRESEEKYRVLFESSRDAIMILDRRGFLDCNQATLDVFGCSSRDQFVSRHPSDLSPPGQPDGKDSAQAAREYIEAAYVTGSQFFEWLHQRIDGTVFPAEVQLSRVELNGTQVLQALVRDITDRKRTEEDRTRLLHDLGGNAIKYMDKLKGRIRIGCRESAGHWEVYVADNGPGIEKAYHEIIFKMLKTAPNHKDQDSTGVGLAIVEKIVKGMGGRIWVESVPGEGSMFVFTIPKAGSE